MHFLSNHLLNHSALGGEGEQELSGLTTKKKTLFDACLHSATLQKISYYKILTGIFKGRHSQTISHQYTTVTIYNVL